MRFHDTPIAGVHLVELDRREDERGFFARLYCADELASHGLELPVAQVNDSFSREAGTLRGLHYQLPPDEETKLVRCVRGALWDAVVDVRRDSPTFGRWFAAELDDDNRRMMLVPPGVAHGFLTLRRETEVIYLVSRPYAPERERGIRWDDPRFRIDWPEPPRVLSEKDRSLPDFDPAYHWGSQ